MPIIWKRHGMAILVRSLGWRSGGNARHLSRRPVAEPAVKSATQGPADEGRNPEKPELCQRPAADENGRAGAPGGVHRGVGDRDADKVDQDETHADRDWGEAGRRFAV